MRHTILTLTTVILILAGCTRPPPDKEPQMPTLREVARNQGLYYGCAVGGAFWRDDTYRALIARECNVIVAENHMKWKALQPRRGEFRWEKAEDLVAFAEKHDMRMRGHCTVWHQAVPDWLDSVPRERDSLLPLLREHITTVVGHFRGRVHEWDVVNEAIADKDSAFLRPSLWSEGVGEDFLDSAFHFAHEADPRAKLFYNDYGAEASNGKADKVYTLVSGMLERGVPIHGVGLQCHFPSDWNEFDSMEENIARLTALGLEIAITELDVRVKLPSDSAALAQQAACYTRLAEIVRDTDGCSSLLTWGITDKYSWVPGFFEGYGEALPFDEEYRRKECYRGIVEAMRQGVTVSRSQCGRRESTTG